MIYNKIKRNNVVNLGIELVAAVYHKNVAQDVVQSFTKGFFDGFWYCSTSHILKVYQNLTNRNVLFR